MLTDNLVNKTEGVGKGIKLRGCALQWVFCHMKNGTIVTVIHAKIILIGLLTLRKKFRFFFYEIAFQLF